MRVRCPVARGPYANPTPGRVWCRLSKADVLMGEHPGGFARLVAEADGMAPEHPLQGYMEIIERDLDRTFPHNEVFREKAPTPPAPPPRRG